MKNRFYIFLCLLFLSIVSFSQQAEEFEIIELIKTTPLKDQQSSGTCWSFATTSFIETEALRLGKGTITLSPIFYVAPTYMEKAENFIEKKGESYFDAGDLTFSVLAAYKKFGAIPEDIYNGIIKNDWQHDHVEMDNLISVMVESVGASGYGRIKPESWRKSIEAVLQAYIGKAPDTFIYKGKEYTPKSFANTFVNINPNNYVEITSYNNYPFYEQCVLNIPANWNSNKYLNLPINDFEKVINHALKMGYSLAWDGDASEPFFNFETGFLELPEEQENTSITQSLRQITFENKSTTDDHNMHIIGAAINKAGKKYYILKNSEGINDLNGYIYMSQNALLLKTISVLVHKDAIPETIKKKIYLAKNN